MSQSTAKFVFIRRRFYIISMTNYTPYNTVSYSGTSGFKFRPGFNRTLRKQAGRDGWTYNHLPKTLRSGYGKRGYLNCTYRRMGDAELRGRTLRQSVLHMPPDKLFGSCPHHDRYVETKRLKAAGGKAKFAEPHFERHGDPIPHDGTVGSARLTRMRTRHTSKLGEPRLSRSFSVLNHGPGKATPYQIFDMMYHIKMCIVKSACDEPRTGPKAEPAGVGLCDNIGNTAAADMVIMPPEHMMNRENPNHIMRDMQRRGPVRGVFACRREDDSFANGCHAPESRQYEEACLRNSVRDHGADTARRGDIPRAYPKDTGDTAYMFAIRGRYHG